MLLRPGDAVIVRGASQLRGHLVTFFSPLFGQLESFRRNFYIISDCCRWSSAPRTRCTCHSITWSSGASSHPNISRPRIFAKQNQQTAPLNLTKLRHKNILRAKNIEHYEAFVSVPKINKTCI